MARTATKKLTPAPEPAVQVEKDAAQVIHDTDLVISAGPVLLELDNPFAPGEPWAMRQPTDVEYDHAVAVREIQKSKALRTPEIAEGAELPPSEEWTAQQNEAIRATQNLILELQARSERTPVEETVLGIYQDHLDSLVRPEEYSLAQELAARIGNRAFQNYLIPRLLVDGGGKPLLNMDTQAGRDKWDNLPKSTRTALRSPLAQVLALLNTAKN